MTGFYMKCNTELKLFNLSLIININNKSFAATGKSYLIYFSHFHTIALNNTM